MTASGSSSMPIPLPCAGEMRELDRIAMATYGIPGLVLMETAGLRTVLMLEEELGPADACGFALILIGPGNNGGDGLVIGRHLHQRGCRPLFLLLTPPDDLRGDAAANLRIIQALGLPLHVLGSTFELKDIAALYQEQNAAGRHCYAIIDALFGTGLTREISGRTAEVIQLMNTGAGWADIPRVAVDIPSGLNADTGTILGVCFRADYTATYGCAKPGQLLHHGPGLCGRLHVLDIGIPPEALARHDVRQEALTDRSVAHLLARIRRQTTSHKGSHGHLLVVAGSPGKTGAAILSVKGALRSGCGLVSLCCPAELNAIYEGSLIEAMTIPLPSSPLITGIEDLATIERHLPGKSALVLGPGMGTAESTELLVLHLYRTVTLPMVVDADALNILARHIHELPPPPGPRVFTPHPGELARILAIPVADIQNDRMQAARTACRLLDQNAGQCTVLLKGAGTVIASGNDRVWINTSGNPGMATGGMGDVLSGIIGALIGQGLAPHEAAGGGAFIHGLAGDMLQTATGTGYTATELADRIPLVIKQLTNSAHTPNPDERDKYLSQIIFL